MTRLTILLAPVRRDDSLALERRGTALIANGERHDLAALAARDDETPGEGWVQAVRATPGGLEAVVLLPHGADAPEEVRFPQPVTVEADGPVPLPGEKAARRRRKS